MKLNLLDGAETAAGLLLNYGVTTQVGDNLRWNGNPLTTEQDSVVKDRRLWIGVLGAAAELAAPEGGYLQRAGSAVAHGSLNSLITTETLRSRLKPASPAAPGQIPQGAPQAAPQAQGDLSGFWHRR